MSRVHWKMEARVRAEHGPELIETGWIEADNGLWYHRDFGFLPVCDAYEAQKAWELRASRKAIWVFFIGLSILLGILTCSLNWGNLCELLSI